MSETTVNVAPLIDVTGNDHPESILTREESDHVDESPLAAGDTPASITSESSSPKENAVETTSDDNDIYKDLPKASEVVETGASGDAQVENQAISQETLPEITTKNYPNLVERNRKEDEQVENQPILESTVSEKVAKDEPYLCEKCEKKNEIEEACLSLDEELIGKVVTQAEFYFSDFNIFKNNFLLNHIRRNKEGWVSMKLVASFRKVKTLTKDWKVVAACLERSKLLQMNEEKSKVRRLEPVPRIQDTSFGKTVVVYNLPFQNPKTEDLVEMFSKFGTVVSADILTSKSEKYNAFHRRCRNLNKDVSSPVFGVIEFEKYADALDSIKDEDSYLPKENKMNVVALAPNIYRAKPRKSKNFPQFPRRRNGGFQGRYEAQNDHQNEAYNPENRRYYAPPGESSYRRYYPRGYQAKLAPPPYEASQMSEKLAPRDHGSFKDGHYVNNSYPSNGRLKLSNTMNTNKPPGPHSGRGYRSGYNYRESRVEA